MVQIKYHGVEISHVLIQTSSRLVTPSMVKVLPLVPPSTNLQ